MRKRRLSEMLRDSHAGSIVIAKLIALALGTVLHGLAEPLAAPIVLAVNWLAVHVKHDMFQPLGPIRVLWQVVVLVPLAGVFWLGAAYLLSAWLYQPSRRVAEK